MKQLLLFLLSVQLSATAFSQGVTLLYKGGQWNDASAWLQINTPLGQTPIQRTPTEFDDVVFSKSMSGLDYTSFSIEVGDSVEIGGMKTTGYRCKSMRISNTSVDFNSAQSSGYSATLHVFTNNGGHIRIDSGGNMSKGLLVLHGGNDNINDLEIIDSKYGTLFTHAVWSHITLKSKSKAKFVNSDCEGWFFGNHETGGELYAENCTFMASSFVLGDSSRTTMLDCTITWGNNFDNLSFGVGPGANFTSRNLTIKALNCLELYTSGSVLSGNIITEAPQCGLRLKQKYPENPLPNIIDGNLKIFGSDMNLSGGLKLSGDLINFAQEGDMFPNSMHYPDSSRVYINGQQIFKIGGVANYGQDVSIENCTQPGCHFRLEFFGDGNSNVVWPVGMPIDTLVINKKGCGKVTFKNPVYVSGEARIQGGQLSLTPNDTIPYKMVCAGDLNIAQGGGVFLRRDSTGDVANIAVGGTIRDLNSAVDSTCTGFSNPYNGKLTLYKTLPGGRLDLAIQSAANIGNLEMLGDGATDFELGSNLSVNDFQFTKPGKLLLGNHTLSVNGSVLNYGPQNYFVTNGTGRLQLKSAGNSEIVFPVGPSTASYNPLTLTNTGTPDFFKVNVQPKVLSGGNSGTLYVGGVVDRTWNVEEAIPGGSNATVKLQWNAGDELPGFTRNSAYLSRYTAGAWDNSVLQPAVGTGPFTLTRNAITTFSPFAVLSPAGVLPVRLVQFSGKYTAQGAVLQWTTENEYNTKSFTVERSNDQVGYVALTTMSANNGSQGRKQYSYNDNSCSIGLNYYRLKMIDLDGTYTYSKVVAVTATDNRSVHVFPNPVNDKLFVRSIGQSGEAILQIMDQKGTLFKTVKTQNGLGVLTISVADLPAGIYSVVVNRGQQKQTMKFVKQ